MLEDLEKEIEQRVKKARFSGHSYDVEKNPIKFLRAALTILGLKIIRVDGNLGTWRVDESSYTPEIKEYLKWGQVASSLGLKGNNVREQRCIKLTEILTAAGILKKLNR